MICGRSCVSKGRQKSRTQGGGGGGSYDAKWTTLILLTRHNQLRLLRYVDYEHTVYSWQLRPIFRIFSDFLAPLKFVTNLIKITFYTRSATDTPKHLSARSRQDVCHVNLV